MVSNVIDNILFSETKDKLNAVIEEKGFECHPFKIGWYNSKVRPAFQLPYPEDTLAFVVLSLPCMFEKSFKPFLNDREKFRNGIRDPIDECMIYNFRQIEEAFTNLGCAVYHDFELLPNRRPKILVQTAAHVSGAAYYYQLSDVIEPPWEKTDNIFGVCIHPDYGGWFAIRGVVVMTRTLYPELPYKPASDVLETQELKVRLLEEFNYNWENWRYRDIIPSKDKYSDEQRLYFSTKPSDRVQLLTKLTT